MKKIIIIALTYMVCCSQIFAQNPTSKPTKVDKVATKAKQSAENVSGQADKIKNDIEVVQGSINTIIKVFEPFLSKNKTETSVPSGSVSPQDDVQVEQNQTTSNEPQSTNEVETRSSDAVSVEEPMPSSPPTNYDGSANLGTQNSTKYGNYLDIGNGSILDDIDAAGASQNVDLIFTATTFAGRTLYAFFSPFYAKNSTKASLYNYGIKFKRNDPHPAKTWERVNESEVALTNLNAAQFEKIKNNSQLESVVRQTTKFSGGIEIYDRLEGKVLAIKTVMDDRVCYGLLYILNQYGTTGESSYIKVKLKVTGFDSNGDGNPDSNMYDR
jgi:hypothetical protein